MEYLIVQFTAVIDPLVLEDDQADHGQHGGSHEDRDMVHFPLHDAN